MKRFGIHFQITPTCDVTFSFAFAIYIIRHTRARATIDRSIDRDAMTTRHIVGVTSPLSTRCASSVRRTTTTTTTTTRTFAGVMTRQRQRVGDAPASSCLNGSETTRTTTGFGRRRRLTKVGSAAMELTTGEGEDPAANGNAAKKGSENALAGWLSEDCVPRNDALDKVILALFVPAVLNFLIIPLVGAVDVFWVGRLEDAVALAAQGAANQVFQSAFWIISFIPSVVAPVVAKAAAGGDAKELSKKIGEGIFCAAMVGAMGMVLMYTMQERCLGIVGVQAGSSTAAQAAPYVGYRALTFIPAIVSTVGFAAFRGTLDVMTPMKITLASQMMNVVLDPLLIFGFGAVKALGVAGAAIATSVSEVFSALLYVSLLVKRKLVEFKDMFRPPSAAALGTLLVGGAGVQLRAVAQNITFLAVMRAILTMDSTGTAAAAHTISSQVFQLGVIAILALSTIATILIPQRMNSMEKGGPREAKRVADRLLLWGLVVGLALAVLQAGAIPFLGIFSSLSEVQEAAVMPCLIGALLQPLNGVVFVGEGLMQGHQAFLRLAAGMFVSTGAMLIALQLYGGTLAGVWFCFTVFNTSRLFFGLRHHFFDGPLAPRNIDATVAKLEAELDAKNQ